MGANIYFFVQHYNLFKRIINTIPNRLLKSFLLISFFYILISCGTYIKTVKKEYIAISSEKVKRQNFGKVYFVDSLHQYLDFKINNFNHKMFFDTGAGELLITNPKFKIDTSKIITSKNIYGFDHKVSTLMSTYSLDSISNDLISIEQKYALIQQKAHSLCDVPDFDGIINNFYFYTDSYVVSINYEEGYIEFVNDFVKDEYQEVAAKFSGMSNKFSILIKINGIEDYFLFDTGNKSSVIVNKEYKNKIKNYLYSISFTSKSVGSNLVLNSLDYYLEKIQMGNGTTFSYPLGLDINSKRNTLNLKFIQNFNWMIDVANQKVYYKPIDVAKLQDISNNKLISNRVLTMEHQNNLIISYINFESPLYKIGKRIIKVADEIITTENICFYRDLLNNTENWDSIKIEFE